MAQAPSGLIRKIRATKCDKYNDNINLIVNLFNNSKEFEDFCISNVEFDPVRSSYFSNNIVHKFIILGKKRSFTCLYHSDMLWVAFKRYIHNMINHECSICYDTIQDQSIFCSQCCSIVCLVCYTKKLAIQRSSKCSMCNKDDPVVKSLVQDIEEADLTFEEAFMLVKKLVKTPISK